ncbi:hypothetical protein ACFY2N_07180 [Streptomyces rubiginosohelvolus]|uniref:hypothetical protein n=1 Tax=Streptomyces rubiginosohelvolus TaxID=67362 RepID=UPI0036C1F2B4
MNALQHAFDLAVRGLLTELPAQLVTALMATAATACIRARKKSRATTHPEGKRDDL